MDEVTKALRDRIYGILYEQLDLSSEVIIELAECGNLGDVTDAILAAQSAAPVGEISPEHESDLAELTDGHLALDRLGATREEHGGELAICERINEIGIRLKFPQSPSGSPVGWGDDYPEDQS